MKVIVENIDTSETAEQRATRLKAEGWCLKPFSYNEVGIGKYGDCQQACLCTRSAKRRKDRTSGILVRSARFVGDAKELRVDWSDAVWRVEEGFGDDNPFEVMGLDHTTKRCNAVLAALVVIS